MPQRRPARPASSRWLASITWREAKRSALAVRGRWVRCWAAHLAAARAGDRVRGGAAALGTLVYYVVLAVTGYDLALLAVAVGWLVGKAALRGSGGMGGRRLQAIAVALTYCSIVCSYVPDLYQEFMKYQGKQEQARQESQAKKTDGAAVNRPVPPPASTHAAEPPLSLGAALGMMALAAAFFFVIALIAPVLGAVENPIGLLIIAIGLFEAWKTTRRVALLVDGPYSTTPASIE